MLNFNPLITPFVSVPVCLLLLAAVFVGYGRLAGLDRRRRRLLLWLRSLFVLGLLVVLLNPYVLRERAPAQNVELVVCVDGSASMGVGPAGRSRHGQAVEWLVRELAGAPAAVIRTYGFDETLSRVDAPGDLKPGVAGTRMYRSLVQLLNAEANRRPTAVVLVSDGVSPADAGLSASVMRQFRTRGIPVHAVQADDGDTLADIRVVSVATPEILPDTKDIPVTLRVDSAGFGGTTVPLVIRRGTRELCRKSVELNGQPQELQVMLPALAAGDTACTVELGTPLRDMAPGNNRATFGFTVRREKIRVLYMEGSPNMRWRPLKNALEEDSAFEVKALHCGDQSAPMSPDAIRLVYKHPGSDDLVYHVAHPTGGYPLSMKAMLDVDVIINSDIPKVCFSAESLLNTARFVEEFGGGFVMIGGNNAFGSGGYNTTAIEKMIPVAMEVEHDTLWWQFKLVFPDGIFDHPLMAIGDDQVSAEKIWKEKFPYLMGMNRVDRTKPGATLLAVNPRLRNQWGPLVVLASQDVGRGRALAFTSDTTPDWGTRFEREWGERTESGNDARYYKRFWQNAMRWLSAGKAMRPFGPVMLEGLPQVWQQGEPQLLRARLYDGDAMHPVQDRQVRVVFTSATGSHAAVCTFDSLRGCHTGQVRIEVPGTYRAEGILDERGDSRSELGTVTVVAANAEMQELRGDDDALRELAQGTGGAFFTLGDKGLLSRHLSELLPGASTVKEAVHLWHSWHVLLLLVALLTAEWLIRRSSGLV